MTGAADAVIPDNAVGMRPRNYQLEMLDASMRENIIVAMDTGSGKTHITSYTSAALRIIRELERCDPDKLVWFMAPTVDLCRQQHKVVSKTILDVQSRTLTGLDNVDLWTDQSIWDAALRDVRIVFSTHAILRDALSHGFVKIFQLALMVFDEAHHCRARHPANRILQDFYHPALAEYGPDAVPDILGLTASPVFKSRLKELEVIESNTNAVCKTPREHRTELLQHTNWPKLIRLVFPSPKTVSLELRSLALELLIKCSATLDIQDDPYVQRLKENLPYTEDKLWDAISKGKTYCNEQMKKFVNGSVHIAEELGPWATDYFIHASIDRFKQTGHGSSVMATWDDDEKAYLVDVLSKIPLPEIQLDPAGAHFAVSPKLKCLLGFLHQTYRPEFSGLIFVKQKVVVTLLTQVLSVHPLTKDRFRCAAYVGWSGHSNRKEYIGDLHDLRSQRDTVDDFRSGRKNLIISTEVLEEGIDISACSMVICYDKPPNLKSYVQRRGRARQKRSTYAIMLPGDDELVSLDRWQNLEASMVKAYQDEERERRQHLDEEDDDEEVPGSLFVEFTRALLKPDAAIAHLHHFCDVLPSEPYVDNRPVFTIDDDDEGSRRRTVILPSSVHPSVRCTSGARGWRTKKAAMKDAAFQAYKALYEFGLVNDNLLPLAKKPELKLDDANELSTSIEVSEQYDPWVDLAHAWSSPDMHQHRITVRQNGVLIEELSMALTVPSLLPVLEPLTLYLDEETTFTLSFGPARPAPSVTEERTEVMRAITALFLQAVSRRFAHMKTDFVTLFGPDVPEAELESWFNRNKGREPASDVYPLRHGHSQLEMGIVRDCMNHNERYIFRKWIIPGPGDSSSACAIECEPFPRRRNLLSRQTLGNKPTRSTYEDGGLASNARVFPGDACTIDTLPFAQSIFGLFISAIVEKLGVVFTATKLSTTILKDVGFSSIRHVVTAITTPHAHAGEDYQRYEFFGDSFLKFTVSCQLFFEYPNWHEGYLTERRDAIVRNPRLTRAALDAGLDAFIITNVLTARKWSPPLISKKIQDTPARRMMSAKVLADVVEALIGAAYMEAGIPAAQTCIKQFLPDIDLQKIDTRFIPRPGSNAHVLNRKLPQHIGYNFNNEALLKEALTHPSCDYDHHTQSYQRLEFLGDAVLDIIMVEALSKHAVAIPQGTMTQIKAAVVNANLLGFFCMEFALTEQTTDVHVTPGKTPTLVQNEENRELWRFMRFRDQALMSNRDAAVDRHRLLHDEIARSLLVSNAYPWELLSRLNADKFFSDLIESILGAIFVDSNGNLAACEAFIERIGILPYIRRILIDGVDVVHPRNRAQRMAKSGRLSFAVQKRQSDPENPAVSAGASAGGGNNYSCMASLDDVQIAVVGDCSSREEAEVKAANAVVVFLSERERKI